MIAPRRLEVPAHLILKRQEIPYDDPRSRFTFQKNLVVTRSALAVFGSEILAACLARIHDEADRHQGLDYLLAHPELIPEEWKGKAVFFWGTIYRDSNGRLYVRCLYWDGGRWLWRSFWLGSHFHGRRPAALSCK